MPNAREEERQSKVRPSNAPAGLRAKHSFCAFAFAW
jgi:hypothetical protein